MVAVLSGQEILKSDETKEPESWTKRLGDTAIMIGVISLSALAIAAVAVATPLVLIISAIIGLATKSGAPTGWRSAGA